MNEKDNSLESDGIDNREFKRLKLLFDYTKFHIGMYATIGGILMASLKYGPIWKEVNGFFLIAALIFFALAGLAGGVVASSIPKYQGYSSFMAADIFPHKCKEHFADTGENWTHKEHLCFWIGVVLVFFAFIFPPFSKIYCFLQGILTT
jgi:hypothetical protein